MATVQFDSDNFTVPDLRVGEIRALRTFHLSRSGYLNPVWYPFREPWANGTNTARCEVRHTPAAPGCGCGFYAYGTYRAARDQDEARKVLAVVACWGRVVPGTRGLRAQYARVEAIWLSGRLDSRLVRRLRQHYPSVTFYRSRRLMLRRHPPTRLDSYQPEPRRRRRELRLSLDIDPLRMRRFRDLLLYLLEGLLTLAGAGLVMLGMVLIERAL